MDLVKQQHDVTQWVTDYSEALFAFAVQRTQQKDEANDLVQETFLAAWRNVERYTGEASVKTWLFTILKNKIIDHYRSSTRNQTATFLTDTDPYFDDSDHWKDGVCPQDWGAGAEDRINTKEFYSVLDGCKNKMKSIYNTVFTMKYMDDLTSDEICTALQISASNYWVIIHRAKTQLRSCLEKNWFTL